MVEVDWPYTGGPSHHFEHGILSGHRHIAELLAHHRGDYAYRPPVVHERPSFVNYALQHRHTAEALRILARKDEDDLALVS